MKPIVRATIAITMIAIPVLTFADWETANSIKTLSKSLHARIDAGDCVQRTCDVVLNHATCVAVTSGPFFWALQEKKALKSFPATATPVDCGSKTTQTIVQFTAIPNLETRFSGER